MEALETLASEWLTNLGKKNGFPNSDDSLIAFDKINEIVMTDPDKAWEFILVAIKMYQDNDDYTGQIAAGPLEDALGYHGEKLIDRIENEAKTNKTLVNMLRGIYQFKTNQEIWTRVQNIARPSND
jgi:CO dehydrogenase/acetyl-CoA synthase beta subunit